MTQDPQRLSDSISRRKFIAATGATGAAAIAGCTESTGEDSEGLSGDVVIKGSSTVFPVSDTFAESYMEENSNVNVTVDSTGSGGGFKNHFCPGESDLNGASRPIKSEEEDQCGENGVSPVEFEIAGDALTMAVNNNADFVDCVTPDEMSQIWRDGGAEQWSDVRDEWPDEDIVKYGPAETSGTYDWFNSNIVGEDYQHTAEHQPTEDDETIVAGIEDNEYAMGYFGYAYYNSNSDSVKALEVDGDSGCTEPGLANAKDGSYPMARPLFIYATESSLKEKEQVYDFMEYFLENAETDTVQEIGYVPSSEQMRDDNLAKLEEYDTSTGTSSE